MSLLELRAKDCRNRAIGIAESLGSGHLGGSLSIIDALVVLYNVKDPLDRVIYSKAHCSEAMYSVLKEYGVIEAGCDLSKLPTHCESTVAGVEYTGGSLGQGLSYAAGVAHGMKLNGDDHKVYCILGDGECDEGSVWEAVDYAVGHNLDNLTILVDCNEYGATEDRVISTTKLSDKFYSHGLLTCTFNGHNYDKLSYYLNPNTDVKYRVYLLETVKGKGVPLWEKNHVHLVYGDMLRMGIKEWRSIGV